MKSISTAGSPTRVVSEALVQAFRRDGYVVVPDLLDDDEVRRFGAAVTAGVRARTAGDTRPVAERSRYQQSFLQCMNLWEDRADVRPLTFHPRLGQAAAELLGVGPGALIEAEESGLLTSRGPRSGSTTRWSVPPFTRARPPAFASRCTGHWPR